MINLSCHWTRGWVLSYFETCGPEATIWPTDRDQTLATNLLLLWKHDTPVSEMPMPEQISPETTGWFLTILWNENDATLSGKKRFCAHIHSTSTCVPTMRNLDFIALQSLPSCGWAKEKLTQVTRDWPFGSDWGSKNTRQPIWVNSFCAMQQWYAMNIVFLYLYSVERNNMMFLIPGMLHLQKLNNFLWEQKSIGIWLFHAKWNLLCVFLSSIGVLSNLLFF